MLPTMENRAGKARQTGEHDVANLNERVIDLEGQAEHHTKAVDGLRTDVVDLRASHGGSCSRKDEEKPRCLR